MLIYFNRGTRDFTDRPVPLNSRAAWEFYISLSGGIQPLLPGPTTEEGFRERTLWAFPHKHAHGWVGEADVDRLVFHFTAVPGELEKLLPSRGYYRTPLTAKDCRHLRQLAHLAEQVILYPTRLVFLQTQGLVTELSLITLREIAHPPLSRRRMARSRTEQALAWYSEHLSDAPTLAEVANAIRVSPTHLRRLFQQAIGERPYRTMNRIRMQRAENLLKGSDTTLDVIAAQVGLSNGSALSRAVKTFFGITPRDLRRGKRPLYRGTDNTPPRDK